MVGKKISKNMKFEAALEALEAEVRLLESGELPLEQALESFKHGVELSRVCMEKLNAVKQEVEKIVLRDDSGSYRLEPFHEPKE